MFGAFGEYVCRREHVSLQTENMYFSCAVDAARYVHQPFREHFFGGLCTVLTCKPRTLQNRRLAAFFGGVNTHKTHTAAAPKARQKFTPLAPLRCSASGVCTAAALAPPLLRVCKYSPRHMRTLPIEYVSTAYGLTWVLLCAEVSIGKKTEPRGRCRAGTRAPKTEACHTPMTRRST